MIHILTLVLFGVAAIIGALALLNVENWKTFLSYFVLIPIANICFGIALWLTIYQLRDP